MTDPLAFMSYARRDNKDEYLTQLRQRLSEAISMQIGEDFEIFQDEDAISWGQRWKERIDKSLDEVTFLIPIVTPSFFRSKNCRDELRQFLDREKELERNDLILPIYYIDSLELREKDQRDADELVEQIHAHQYADWRELRYEPFTKKEVRMTLEHLAVRIRDVLVEVVEQREPHDHPPSSAAQQRDTEESPSQVQSSVSATETGETTKKPADKTEPPTLTVDPLYRGDYISISEAIGAAPPGTRILVHPGLYKEGIVIDKPLEIIGQGDPEDIVVQASGEAALQFKTTMGRVSNLTLQRAGGEGDSFGVDIGQGRLELEECDISSDGLSCVAIHGGAHPYLHRNRIHNSKQGGVYVYDRGKGTLEDNDIFGNTSGVGISGEGSDPTLRNNRIHDGKEAGVVIYEGGKGTLEGNDIFGNTFAGVQIRGEGSDPTLRNNRIHDGKQSGVLVSNGSKASLEDIDIFANAAAGLEIRDQGSEPTLRNNRINKNAYAAVWVHDGGGGTFEDNDLRDNGRKGAWDVSKDSESRVKRSNNKV